MNRNKRIQRLTAVLEEEKANYARLVKLSADFASDPTKEAYLNDIIIDKVESLARVKRIEKKLCSLYRTNTIHYDVMAVLFIISLIVLFLIIKKII